MMPRGDYLDPRTPPGYISRTDEPCCRGAAECVALIWFLSEGFVPMWNRWLALWRHQEACRGFVLRAKFRGLLGFTRGDRGRPLAKHAKRIDYPIKLLDGEVSRKTTQAGGPRPPTGRQLQGLDRHRGVRKLAHRLLFAGLFSFPYEPRFVQDGQTKQPPTFSRWLFSLSRIHLAGTLAWPRDAMTEIGRTYPDCVKRAYNLRHGIKKSKAVQPTQTGIFSNLKVVILAVTKSLISI